MAAEDLPALTNLTVGDGVRNGAALTSSLPAAAAQSAGWPTSLSMPERRPSSLDIPVDVTASCSIAVLIPCYNEALTIAQVVTDFADALPSARIYVYDNNSQDGTAQISRAAGAIVRRETMQGKGHVVRRMFRDIDADLYILVDGDGTYDASAAPLMVATALSGPFDLVNGARVDQGSADSYRRGHRVGNQVLTGLVQRLFGDRTIDMLSGYKVLSRRFVKSYPVLSSGFEVETELTVHALELDMPMAHVETRYGGRAPGAQSKLNTFRDGWRIMRMIIELFKQERPLLFFSLLGLFLAASSAILATPLIIDFFQTHTVPRLPTAVLVTGMMLLAFLSFTCGLILDTVTRGRLEAKLLRYLSISHVDRVELAEAWLRDDALRAAVDVSAATRTRGKVRWGRRALVLVALVALTVVAVVTALAALGVLQVGIGF